MCFHVHVYSVERTKDGRSQGEIIFRLDWDLQGGALNARAGKHSPVFVTLYMCALRINQPVLLYLWWFYIKIRGSILVIVSIAYH